MCVCVGLVFKNDAVFETLKHTFIMPLMLHVFNENEGLLGFQENEMESSWFLHNCSTDKPPNVNDLLNIIIIIIIMIIKP